ncbi:MAG: cytochrome c oxidase subunit 3 [Thermoguttaceae bacterium]|jgi:cytochrome c oxidase subunit 3
MTEPAAHAQDPRSDPWHLAHHFTTPRQQFDSGKLGIWLFLATEILLFSGLFCAYAVFRANHPEVFVYAHLYLSKPLGALNTLILIFSSFTMASAVRAAQLGQTRWLVRLLAVTLVCAGAFLCVKFIEYKAKWEEGLLTGARYRPEAPPPGADVPKEAAIPRARPAPKPAPVDGLLVERSTIAPAAVGPSGLAPAWLAGEPAHPPLEWRGPEPYNVQVFFSFYFVMTGLHGIHVLGGMAAIGWVLVRARRGEFGPQYFSPVDFTGLYWHLVDLIWIFLFPLLYLIT